MHPNNRYALKNEGQYGKTEMWYVMDAGKDAHLYYGFRKEISKEEFEQRIKEDTLLEVLNAVPVQKGDVLFIESGTIHAIGKEILIAEIQQNSNVTYRVYDYGRVGKDGKKRDLHIEKALAVTNRVPIVRDKSSYPHVADCDYFTVDKLNLDGRIMNRIEGFVSEESFASILILDGEGEISSGEETLSFQKGDSLFLSAGSGSYQVEGICDALVTTIREKAAPVRIGIDMGSTEARIGLVDIHQKLLVQESLSIDASAAPDKIIRDIAQTALALLEKQGIAVDQCVGAGIGVPGTIDRKAGVVRSSNNIRWAQVNVVGEIGKYLPIPVHIANNADCAALGEAVAGAGKECQDVVMLTIGAGVGGGVILDGQTYHGKGVGGSELGHMVIVEDGKECSCGRKGCLEAYVSVKALIKEAETATGRKLEPEEIFRAAGERDEALKKVTEDYIRKLGTGIVNIVNIFRPQLVILGGGISGQCGMLLGPLRERIEKDCFGGRQGELPEVETAELGKEAGIIGASQLGTGFF